MSNRYTHTQLAAALGRKSDTIRRALKSLAQKAYLDIKVDPQNLQKVYTITLPPAILAELQAAPARKGKEENADDRSILEVPTEKTGADFFGHKADKIRINTDALPHKTEQNPPKQEKSLHQSITDLNTHSTNTITNNTCNPVVELPLVEDPDLIAETTAAAQNAEVASMVQGALQNLRLENRTKTAPAVCAEGSTAPAPVATSVPSAGLQEEALGCYRGSCSHPTRIVLCAYLPGKRAVGYPRAQPTAYPRRSAYSSPH